MLATSTKTATFLLTKDSCTRRSQAPDVRRAARSDGAPSGRIGGVCVWQRLESRGPDRSMGRGLEAVGSPPFGRGRILEFSRFVEHATLVARRAHRLVE